MTFLLALTPGLIDNSTEILDKEPPGQFLMHNLSRQTSEPDFDDFYASTLSPAAAVSWRQTAPLACDVS